MSHSLPQTAVSGTEAVVTVRGLVRGFGNGNVLDGLSLDLQPGSFTALLGRSGCGKSTLLRTLAKLDPAPHGTVTLPDERAVVFQEPRLVPWMPVLRNVTLGLRHADAEARGLAALAEVGLSHRTRAWPLTLSGGEAQRAALARALVREPRLLLLDEPFAALDALTRLRMQGLVETLWRAHAPAILLVTHDVDEALLLADRALVMADGRIAADIPVPLARPRRHGNPGFIALRSRLLSELGIDEEHLAGQEPQRTATDSRSAAPGVAVGGYALPAGAVAAASH
ncbi:sulfonate ABC transporter ATP-binding protein [Azospirillum argentinense]|uniref:Sulfonate ABC transporter ATP-binding protein n=1 Tax=Azospirillum argentinense TaxID=2970906 RepID=A0A060DI90_9PROT|nr:ABC transporter ATP-binding protein [Azospirillum argentinense]AIB12622.1 sulfonate ABC transporter ATP-binding protein [Azospirillum argentinense]EZQ09410.1 sulfonate ABC transporter ATP-binding protein [Azospirillum argentinense]